MIEEPALPDLVAALSSFGLPFRPIEHFRSGKTAVDGRTDDLQNLLHDIERIAALGLSADLLVENPVDPRLALADAWLYDAPSGRLVRGMRWPDDGVFRAADPADGDIVRRWPSYLEILDRKGGAHLRLVSSRHALLAAARDPDIYPGSAESRMKAIARTS